MTPQAFLAQVIDPGLTLLAGLGGPPVSDQARRFMLAIALQESGPTLTARYQNSPSDSAGPARGWWQFEQGGGVVGVLTHRASATLAQVACGALTVLPASPAVWRAIEGNDLLAAIIARLLIITHPEQLPEEERAGWAQYLSLWRPGKPHAERWHDAWVTAGAAVRLEPVTTRIAPGLIGSGDALIVLPHDGSGTDAG